MDCKWGFWCKNVVARRGSYGREASGSELVHLYLHLFVATIVIIIKF